jgi:hypothetical protein
MGGVPLRGTEIGLATFIVNAIVILTVMDTVAIHRYGGPRIAAHKERQK